MASRLEDRIADEVLRGYDVLPAKFKPTRDANGLSNWVPLSGIVFTDEKEAIEVVALASVSRALTRERIERGLSLLLTDRVSTGMKCLPQSQVKDLDGEVLHDSHAEVLAIRLFNHFLLSECLRLVAASTPYESPFVYLRDVGKQSKQSQQSQSLLQPFAIRDRWRIWMYCSEAPCGDASMELTMAKQQDATPWSLPSLASHAETENASLAAKPSGSIPSPVEYDHATLKGRGYFSELGAVRRKPGRGDSPPTLSKSCSDKLAMKQCTSLLSSMTSLLVLPSSAYLHHLLLPSSQYVASACERAFGASGRMAAVRNLKLQGSSDYSFRPFQVRTTEREFRFSKRAGAVRESVATDRYIGKDDAPLPHASTDSKPSNIAAVHSPYLSEVLIGGIIQGHKRPCSKSTKTSMALTSSSASPSSQGTASSSSSSLLGSSLSMSSVADEVSTPSTSSSFAAAAAAAAATTISQEPLPTSSRAKVKQHQQKQNQIGPRQRAVASKALSTRNRGGSALCRRRMLTLTTDLMTAVATAGVMSSPRLSLFPLLRWSPHGTAVEVQDSDARSGSRDISASNLQGNGESDASRMSGAGAKCRYSDVKSHPLLSTRRQVKETVKRDALRGWIANEVDDFEIDLPSP